MSRSHRRTTTAVLALSAGLVLGGCAQDPLPTPSAPAPQSPAPAALTGESATNVLADVGATVAAADAEHNPDLLAPRAFGPAVTLRAGQYKAESLTGGRLTLPPLSTDPQTVYTPIGDVHPATMMSVTAEPEGGNLPQLLALQQVSPRDPYRLWGWVELHPGVTVPALPGPEVGAETLAPDAGGLVATPQDAVARYVATLEDPADAAAFTPTQSDPYKQQHRRLEDQLGPLVAAAGTVVSVATPGENSPVAIRTADGGALVLGEVRTNETIRRTIPGSQLALSGDYLEFSEGNAAVVGSVTFDFDSVLAFYVPPEGAQDPTIQVLGSTRALIATSRDDAANPDA